MIALAFYRDVLGMTYEPFGEGRLALKFGNQKINLHEWGREFAPRAHVAAPGTKLVSADYSQIELRLLSEVANVPALRKAFQDVAIAVAQALAGDEFDTATLTALVRDALNFPVRVVELEKGLGVLELFHGPTFAFKDFGARTLAQFMSRANADGPPITILVATSGDTGSAVACAFHNLPNTRVVVLYPEGQVSAVQEAQFTTLGGNVTAVAVAGTFDDCQRLAKDGFKSVINLRQATEPNVNIEQNAARAAIEILQS